MPSSAYSAYYCSTGPSSVVPAPQITTPAMHAYYYKNTAPLTGLGSPPMPTSHRAPMCTSPQTATAAQQQAPSLNNGLGTNSHLNTPSPGRFNSPSPHVAATTTTTGTYSARSSSRNCQPNGALPTNPDIMSMSMHSPPVSFHYWASNPTPVTCAAPYTPHVNSPPHTYSATATNTHTNPSVSNTSSKTTNMPKSSANGHIKISSQGSGARPLWKDRPHVGRYSLIRTIGKGNFAKVKLAQHLTTGMQVAVKVIDKTLLNHSSMQKLFREVRVLKTLNHPNIIKLLEVIESERHLYLVMEYASGGEVFDYLVSHGKMKEADARVKFRQIVSAVQYCHQKMVVHRDLKAENLLLDADLNIKIADFGFSNYFSTSQKLDTFCGSPPYAAPELFLGRKYEGPEVDVWSLGVILYTLVSGTLPFDGKNLKELRERVLRGTYRVPFYMTRECEMLLKKMLVLNPAKRIPLTEVMRDPWLNTGFDTILRPFSEPPTDYCDPERIETMIRLGFQRHEIQEALTQQRFNNITATYILLSRYDPQIHGLLPGLSNVNSRSTKFDSHSRSRQPESSMNNGNNGALSNSHSSRPSSALPSNTHATPTPLSQVRRTPDEGSVSRKSSFTSSRHAVESAEKENSVLSSASGAGATTTTVSTVGSTSTATVVTSTLENSIATFSQPHSSVRRSATIAEYSDRKSYSPSLNTGANLSGLPFVSRSPSTVTTTPPVRSSPSPPPSQAPPQEYPPPQHSVPAQASVIIHPASVTAHLTLINPTNGPSCIAPGLFNQSPLGSPSTTPAHTVAAQLPSQTVMSRSRPFPRKLSSHGIGNGATGPTAPLAQSEDDPTPAGGAVRSPDKQLTGSGDNRFLVKCNGMVTNQECDQTLTVPIHTNSDGESNSENDAYDGEWGSSASSPDSDGSTPNSRHREHRTHRRRHRPSIRRRAPTGDSQPPEPPATSVVLAAAPHSAGLSRSASKSNHSGAVAPDDRSSDKQGSNGSNFTRMPSVRRRSSVRSRTTTSMPTTTGTVTSGSTVSGDDATASPMVGGDHLSPIPGNADQSSVANEGKTTANTISTRFPRGFGSNYEGTEFLDSAPSSSNGGDSSIANKDRYPLNVAPKPRGLFRGTPNAADILSEVNPFRIAADATTMRASSTAPAPPAIPPHSSRPVPLNTTPAQSTGRAFTPPVVGTTNSATSQMATFTTGTIRRPVAPPPPLATTSVTNPTTRMSYAYHSLRLPSSANTSTSISMNRETTPDVGGRYNGRPVEPSVASLWASGAVSSRDEDRATPTPPDSHDPYVLPFNRSIPERSTIQHVPTGRARERLEGSGAGARLVRHPGTHSIATQSIRIRTRSPSCSDQADGHNGSTPRQNSPDDLSISSTASSISTLGQNGSVNFNEGTSGAGFETVSRHARRQSNTLGSPTQPMSRHYSMRPPSTRDRSNHTGATERSGNGALNNFFRTLTTRISRSKLFRRSAVMQPETNYADLESGRVETRDRLDSMLAPTMELDKVVVTRGSPSPDSAPKSYTARLPRSRSGVTPHRPASQVTPRITEACESGHDELRGSGAGRGSSSNTGKISHMSENSGVTVTAGDDENDEVDAVIRGSLTRRSSKRSSSSRDYSRSHSAHRSSNTGSGEDRTPSTKTPTAEGTATSRSAQSGSRRHVSASPADSSKSGSLVADSGKLSGGGKMHRSMRYVLRPTFARCPLDEVMVEVKQSLAKHNVDFEMVGEHKIQCVYGDPSRNCHLGSEQIHKPSADSGGTDVTGVVHWEMEIGKLAGIGMNGIRFKRINGSMTAFKQIAKKLAADLRF